MAQPMERNRLDFPITAGALLKYALPTILSSIFMNIYSMVDALFVANLIGMEALSAVNIVGPALAIALAIGTMIATGGCALVSKQMGAGDAVGARENFSFFVLFAFAVSLAFCLLGIALRDPLLYWMGADEALYPICEAYAVPVFVIIPFAMIGMILQIFFVAAGAPGLGFGLSIAGGVLNIGLDYVLIAAADMGVQGAALATGIGYCVQSVIGAAYFALKRDGSLCFVRPKWNGPALLKACSNGMSEMVSMLAVSITMIAMNVILMNLAGSDGVAAAAIVLSAQTILSAVYMGYMEGIAPVISYNYGAGADAKLRQIYRAALWTIAVMSALTFAAAFPLAKPLALIYSKDAPHVQAMAIAGIRVFAPAFLLMGFNMFASSMFTAFNDGKTSAIISLLRSLVFLIIPLLILPRIWGVDGVWASLPLAELLALAVSVYYFRTKKNVYHYA